LQFGINLSILYAFWHLYSLSYGFFYNVVVLRLTCSTSNFSVIAELRNCECYRECFPRCLLSKYIIARCTSKCSVPCFRRRSWYIVRIKRFDVRAGEFPLLERVKNAWNGQVIGVQTFENLNVHRAKCNGATVTGEKPRFSLGSLQ
jgi:hypothetical protein